MPFRDADAEVEAAAGRSIAEIFEQYGEAAFRDGERRVIARLLAEPPHVLATGGGAFMNPETRALIKEKAISVWLKADIEVLARRVGRKDNRPLLAGRIPPTCSPPRPASATRSTPRPTSRWRPATPRTRSPSTPSCRRSAAHAEAPARHDADAIPVGLGARAYEVLIGRGPDRAGRRADRARC